MRWWVRTRGRRSGSAHPGKGGLSGALGQFSQCFEVFDDRPTVCVREFRADNAIAERCIAKFVSAIRIPDLIGSELKTAVESRRAVTDVLRVKLPASGVETLVSLRGRNQHLVKVRHGAVMQVGRRSPDSAQRALLICQGRLDSGITEAIPLDPLRWR